MAPSRAPSTGLLRSLRAIAIDERLCLISPSARPYSSSPSHDADAQVHSAESFYRNPDPATVFVPQLERRLVRKGTPPIGSRRRRVALANAGSVPFDQLPFQCFQDARKVLMEDRAEKIKMIEKERAKIARLRAVPDEQTGGTRQKETRLRSMQKTLEHWKILADINDPMVKKRFEDGLGDMNKPIYRYLAQRKWEEYKKRVQVQRLEQMKVYPDVLPKISVVVDIDISFGKKKVHSGDFVPSKTSESPFRLKVQAFDKGEKLITIALIDPDVPNLETDSFDSRCHFLASNISISHVNTVIDLATLSAETQVMLPYFPPYAQKGSPYHRLAIVILQQKDNTPVDLQVAMNKTGFGRDNFSLRAFVSRHLLTPIGASLFRAKWDEGTAEVMTRAGVEGANVELKRIKVEPLPYKRRNPSTFR